MALTYRNQMFNNGHVVIEKNTIGFSTAAIGVTATNNMNIYITDTVAVRRRVEIYNGWIKLLNTIRDRNLLRIGEEGGSGNPFYIVAPIDSIVEANIEVDFDAAGFALMVDGTIAIGVGSSVYALMPPVEFHNATIQTFDFAIEDQMHVAAA